MEIYHKFKMFSVYCQMPSPKRQLFHQYFKRSLLEGFWLRCDFLYYFHIRKTPPSRSITCIWRRDTRAEVFNRRSSARVPTHKIPSISLFTFSLLFFSTRHTNDRVACSILFFFCYFYLLVHNSKEIIRWWRRKKATW